MADEQQLSAWHIYPTNESRELGFTDTMCSGKIPDFARLTILRNAVPHIAEYHSLAHFSFRTVYAVHE